jgi:flavin-dependent dehydrogenase
VRTAYGHGLVGRALTRRDLDAWLLERAVRAGARFQSGLVARAALLDDRVDRPFVRGLVLAPRGRPDAITRVPASITIAADGRRSQVALGLGLLAHPAKPRRWAFGTYASGIAGTSDVGEMHVRAGYYLGIAPLDDRVANVCVVTGARPEGRRPLEVIQHAIARDRTLQARFAGATLDPHVRVLGPLAVEARAAGVPGLLLTGDAAGFIDPMTGDGLTLAMRGAVLAAEEALRSLQVADVAGACERLALTRRDQLGSKLRFNRALRRLVGSRLAMEVAGASAAVAPGLFGRVVRFAGDAP